MKNRGHSRVLGWGFAIVFLFALLYFHFSSDLDASLMEETRDSVVLVNYEFDYFDEEGYAYTGSYTGSGIIIVQDGELAQIVTNRHVVDCWYGYDCWRRFDERITVRLNNGKIYNYTNVSFAPQQLDIALIDIKPEEQLRVVEYTTENILGEEVYAVGYPIFSDRVVEKSITPGKTIGYRDLVTEDGLSFKGIDSDVFIDNGNSGGGLFDSNGYLLGIITWGDDSFAYAIGAEYFEKVEDFDWCENGYYLEEGVCLEYCVGYFDEEGVCAPI